MSCSFHFQVFVIEMSFAAYIGCCAQVSCNYTIYKQSSSRWLTCRSQSEIVILFWFIAAIYNEGREDIKDIKDVLRSPCITPALFINLYWLQHCNSVYEETCSWRMDDTWSGVIHLKQWVRFQWWVMSRFKHRVASYIRQKASCSSWCMEGMQITCSIDGIPFIFSMMTM